MQGLQRKKSDGSSIFVKMVLSYIGSVSMFPKPLCSPRLTAKKNNDRPMRGRQTHRGTIRHKPTRNRHPPPAWSHRVIIRPTDRPTDTGVTDYHSAPDLPPKTPLPFFFVLTCRWPPLSARVAVGKIGKKNTHTHFLSHTFGIQKRRERLHMAQSSYACGTTMLRSLRGGRAVNSMLACLFDVGFLFHGHP